MIGLNGFSRLPRHNTNKHCARISLFWPRHRITFWHQKQIDNTRTPPLCWRFFIRRRETCIGNVNLNYQIRTKEFFFVQHRHMFSFKISHTSNHCKPNMPCFARCKHVGLRMTNEALHQPAAAKAQFFWRGTIFFSARIQTFFPERTPCFVLPRTKISWTYFHAVTFFNTTTNQGVLRARTRVRPCFFL